MSAAPDMIYREVFGRDHVLVELTAGNSWQLRSDVKEWCESHIGPVQVVWRLVDVREVMKVNPPAEPTEVQILCYGFSSDADAMAFKMRWNGFE